MRYSKTILIVTGFLLFLSAFATQVKAQDIEKTVIITKKWGGGIERSDVVAYVLSVTESYNPDMTIDGYSFLLSAQNDKYERIQDLFVLAGGDAQEVYNFTKWVLRFMDICKIEDVKVPIQDFTIPLTIEYVNWGMLGKKYFIKNGSAYHMFKKSEFEKIQKELMKYCKKHNIEINTNIEVDVNPSLGKK